jgi:ribosomal protein L11 methyltransferase
MFGLSVQGSRFRPQASSLTWAVSVSTAPEAEEAVGAWWESVFGSPASAYTDLETGVTTVTVWLARRPDWSRARRLELAHGLARIRACGLQTGTGRLALRRVRRRDWAESWKRDFAPLTIGGKLLLRPSWSRRQPRPGQTVVTLDPGLSFGTGRHPTTAFCLEQLAARRRPGTAQSFLDAGTGSGILAIAAARLGYAPVVAFDLDPEAVRVARANARRNGVSRRVRLFAQAVARLPRRPAARYSLVCANLSAGLLIAARDRLRGQLRADGVLVVAGILRAEFPRLRRAFARSGLRLLASRVAKEWRSAAFAPARARQRPTNDESPAFRRPRAIVTAP